MHFIPFTAQTRMRGVDFDGITIRKGAPDTMIACSRNMASPIPRILQQRSNGLPAAAARPWSWCAMTKPWA